eukprot:8896668-Pyramimonas_sp.AAC.1
MGPSILLASLTMLSSHSVPHGVKSGTTPLGPLRTSREVYTTLNVLTTSWRKCATCVSAGPDFRPLGLRRSERLLRSSRP